MPAVAVHMGERFKNPTVKREITRLVRSEPKKVVNVAEALPFVLGDRVERGAEVALKVCQGCNQADE
jgi:phosphatidylinositol 4-kinase